VVDARGWFSSPSPWFEPFGSGESVATKRRFKNLLDVSGLTEQLVAAKPRLATEAEIGRLHTPEYMARMKELSDGYGGEAGEATPFGPGGYEIALLAAGGCIAAVDAVLDGVCKNVYALVRPPGHHAEANRGRGFCMFGNTALAAMHARQTRGLARVAVVDWDVHHGNGTQAAFYNDPSVLTISLHQDTPTRSNRENRGDRNRQRRRLQHQSCRRCRVPGPAATSRVRAYRRAGPALVPAGTDPDRLRSGR
jgi:acetoin utilization deacetylase AcuC-like enzyme